MPRPLASAKRPSSGAPEVYGEPGDCFAAVLGSGELAVFRGSPREPGDLVWSSRRGALHWAKRRTPVAVNTPRGLLTLRAEEGGVRTDGQSLGKHQSLELWELWDGRVALRALDHSFLCRPQRCHWTAPPRCAHQRADARRDLCPAGQ